MNKQFMMKMLQAKQLEYEALKEIMPEPMVKKVAELEKDLVDFGKEYFMTVLCADKKQEATSETKTNTKVRKVTID